MRILSIDIGGTKTAAAGYRLKGASPMALSEHPMVSPNSTFSSAEEAMKWAAFACSEGDSHWDMVVIGAAGPARDGEITMTNLGWSISEISAQVAVGAPLASVRNDFELVAHSLGALRPNDVEVLIQGDTDANPDFASLVVGAGTGLGHAWRRGDGAVVASEAGHADFASFHLLPQPVLQCLRSRGQRVSVEDVLSGKGLSLIYSAISGVGAEVDPHLVTQLASDDDELAAKAIRIFSRVLGGHLGNMALVMPDLRGMYLTGGVINGVWPYLSLPQLVHEFGAKSPMESLLAKVSLYRILDPYPGLIGGALLASRAGLED